MILKENQVEEKYQLSDGMTLIAVNLNSVDREELYRSVVLEEDISFEGIVYIPKYSNTIRALRVVEIVAEKRSTSINKLEKKWRRNKKVPAPAVPRK